MLCTSRLDFRTRPDRRFNTRVYIRIHKSWRADVPAAAVVVVVVIVIIDRPSTNPWSDHASLEKRNGRRIDRGGGLGFFKRFFPSARVSDLMKAKSSKAKRSIVHRVRMLLRSSLAGRMRAIRPYGCENVCVSVCVRDFRDRFDKTL